MSDSAWKILVVDDEYVFCRSLKKYLEKKGYRVLVATDGSHALDLVAEESPVLLTLDIRMPGLNGYEVLKKLRQLAPEMPVVVITAVDVPRMEEMLEHSGAREVLQKPINLEQLGRIIADLLGAPEKPS